MPLGRDIRAEQVRRLRLAYPRNIVVLTFDGHQRDPVNLGGVNGSPAVSHLAFR